MNLNLDMPDQGTLVKDANTALEQATFFVIDSPAMYELAADELKEIKAKAKALNDKRKAITTPIDEAKKSVMDLFRAPLDTLAKAEDSIKKAMMDYTNEQRRIALENQIAAQKESSTQRASLKAEAEKIAETGDVEQAAALVTAAVAIAPAVAAEKPIKVDGISTRVTWSAQVTDLATLIKYVAENPQFAGLLQPDQKALNDMARALKGNLKIPGVLAVTNESITARK